MPVVEDLVLSPLVDEDFAQPEPVVEPVELPPAPEVTEILVPAGYRLDREFPSDPNDLIKRFVYLKATGRRSLDWFLARVASVAKPADNYLGRVMALTHQVQYCGARPRGANASGTELVDLGRRNPIRK